jgi:hypothetical protein
MAARAGVFTRAHPSSEPGYATLQAQLDERLARAGVIAARQHDGLAIARGARANRKELRVELHSQVLPHLIRVGQSAAKDRPELAARFVLPSQSLTYKSYLTAASAMLALADTQKDLLVTKGLTQSALEDLRRMVAEFDVATTTAQSGRLDHIGARADLEVVTGELMEIVRVLDGINRYRYGKDPEALAEWNAAKHLPPTPVSKTPPPSPTSPKPGDVASAA